MPRYTVIETRVENPEEQALREWFDKQHLASPDTLQDAAKLIVGLITGLLTVLAVGQEHIPAYLSLPGVRWLGAGAIVALLVSLIAGLFVVLPFAVSYQPSQPETQRQPFAGVLRRKAIAMIVTAVAFGAGIVLFALALLIAMLRM